ncbi:MAG: brpA 3 [Nocardioidaceae bacterium]|nr:brpA 3 [Nocardioidaceae bacterium]
MRSRARGTRTARRPEAFLRTLAATVGVVAFPTIALGFLALFLVRGKKLSLTEIVVVPKALEILSIACAVGLVVWLMVLMNTYLNTRPLRPTSGQRWSGTAMTMVLGILITAPLATGSYYAFVQRDTLNAIVTNEHTATTPSISKGTHTNPWGDKKRVNVLLLGGDGGVGREGIRTDTVILVSINTRTGKSTMFSLPRNLRNVPFPEGSPLAAAYPHGFDECCSPGESMLNAIYRNVPAKHPGILGKSDNEGADAVKLGVSGALGIPVDYYLLVNLDGFRQIVQAIGGITVNVNERVAINGETDRHIPPTGWIEPGPNQHLDGYHALWFTRGRYGSTDYKRMERQRCAIKAIVQQASPARLLARYTQLAKASKKILRTDIPQQLLPAFLDSAMKMKSKPLTSVVFQYSAEFDPNDPDFDTMHAAVQKALYPHKQAAVPAGDASSSPSASASATASPSDSATGTADEKTTDATDTASDCTYQPVSAAREASTTR